MRISGYPQNITENERRLPLYVTTVGQLDFQDPIHRPAGVPDYQLLYTAEGRGIVRIREEEHPVEAGQIFILPPFTPHEYHADGDSWKTQWITYGGSAARSCFDMPADIRDGTGFPEHYRRIYARRNSAGWRRDTGAELYSLLLDLVERPGLVPLIQSTPACDIAAAVQYIAEHYTETVELSRLAAIAGVSEGHFCRLFKEYTHMRPVEYVTHLRIETAKSLLLDAPSLSVRQIALRVGYTSPSYFSSLFRAAEGMTPAEYRARLEDR